MTKSRKNFTLQAIDARKTMGLTQAQAAPLLGLAERSLQKYEEEVVSMHPDIVSSMAAVYHEPRLRTLYCEQECAIGRQEHRPCGCEKAPEVVMLDLILQNDERKIPEVVGRLRRIMQDGVIDEDEEATMDECIDFLDDLTAGIKGLKLAVQAMARTSRNRRD